MKQSIGKLAEDILDDLLSDFEFLDDLPSGTPAKQTKKYKTPKAQKALKPKKTDLIKESQTEEKNNSLANNKRD